MQKNKNIVFIGFMGCGKTTVGRALASHIKYRFVDLDAELEKKYGMSIPHMFEQYGEYYFRGAETHMVEWSAGLLHSVIATGGGVIKNPYNISQLSKNGRIFYLKADVDHINRNTVRDQNRPLLAGKNRKDTIRRLLQIRAPLYERAAHVTISVSGKTVMQIVQEIIEFY